MHLSPHTFCYRILTMTSLITWCRKIVISKTRQQPIFRTAQLFYVKYMKTSFANVPLNKSPRLPVYYGRFRAKASVFINWSWRLVLTSGVSNVVLWLVLLNRKLSTSGPKVWWNYYRIYPSIEVSCKWEDTMKSITQVYL